LVLEPINALGQHAMDHQVHQVHQVQLVQLLAQLVQQVVKLHAQLPQVHLMMPHHNVQVQDILTGSSLVQEPMIALGPHAMNHKVHQQHTIHQPEMNKSRNSPKDSSINAILTPTNSSLEKSSKNA